ncbi:hypothetical protein BSL78_16766 [Apostichopus japonicus]|uniref:AB hydrolase-1 domain-containing protein n=1 Tax=Stichopus japonicus TaxID=307972 RepID=A0A2G8KEE4_STIJA|nr:hypothetical protein BSL78_16766 [Apostichopus japonicus]
MMSRLVIKHGAKSFTREKIRDKRPACLEDPKIGKHKFVKTNLMRQKDLIINVNESLPWIPVVVESQQPQDTRDDYRAEKVAGDLKTLVRVLGYTSCILVGHDWGGIICWYFAHLFPEMTHRVIILNAPNPTIFHDAILSSWQQRKNSLYMFFFQIPWLPEVFMKWNDYAMLDKSTKGEDTLFFTREEIEGLKYSMSRPGTRTGSLNYYRANISAMNFLCTVTRPTLIIWGMKDKYLSPILLNGLEKLVSDLKISKVEDAAHWVHQNQSRKVNQLILQYLQTHHQ